MRFSSFFIFWFIPLISASLINAKCERNATTHLKTYKINLDNHPSERFDEVLNDFKPQVITWINKEK